MKTVYVSGPYRAIGIWRKIPIIRTIIVIMNIIKARKVAIKYWRQGFAVICPHMNTALFEGNAPDNVWLDGDIEIVKRCDTIVMMKGYTQSVGAMKEWHEAIINGKDVWYE